MAAPVKLAALRRLIVAAQGFPRKPTVGTEDDVAAAVNRLGAVQIDPLAVVERSHRLVLGARVGPYPEAAVGNLLAAGRIFEYWAHERCLLPIDAYPLIRAQLLAPGRWRSYQQALRDHPDVIEHVRERIYTEGPLPSRAFAGERAPDTGWKPAGGVLEALWDAGELAIAGRGSDKLFDLTERVIPKRWLEAPEPSEPERLRDLALRAVRARGVLTEAAIREHWRLKGGRVRLQPRLHHLVDEGALREVQAEDGGPPVYVEPEAELDADPGRTAVLLSPFDNLVWDRPLLQRLFGFSHLIEIYKRQPERRYGYYVLPLLVGDRLAGRADLKTDRKEHVLRVLAFHPEPGVRSTRALDTAFERALARLAALVGVGTIAR